ncbi:hypothetical protein SH661x_001630 [Planctomicrobium sp. SH661]|uniref:hypothetical protein n=1 Tax=Planctomicrobium sp. SH661 TaxID=3448124 RepID=UPI003F5C66EC
MLAQVLDIVSEDAFGSIIEAMRPALSAMLLKFIGFIIGMEILKFCIRQLSLIIRSYDDQKDWERVYNSMKPFSSDDEMRRLRNDFWGKRNQGTIRSRRARKNKFFVSR